MSCRARSGRSIGIKDLSTTDGFDAPGLDREPILKNFSRAKPPRQLKVTKVGAPISKGKSVYGMEQIDAPGMDREPILKTFSRAKPPRQQKVTKVVAPISHGKSEYGTVFEPDRRVGSLSTNFAPTPRPRSLLPTVPEPQPPLAFHPKFSNKTQFSAPVPFSKLDRKDGSIDATVAPTPRSRLLLPVVPGPPPPLALHPKFSNKTQFSAPVPSLQQDRKDGSKDATLAQTPRSRLLLPVVPGPPPPLALHPNFSNKTQFSAPAPYSQPNTWQSENIQIQPDSFVKDPLVAGLDKSNFEPFVKSKEAVLVFFYDPFNTSSYYPNTQLKQAANETTRDNHAYAAVNCMLEAELCIKQGITDLPAFKLFSQGVPVSTIRHMNTFDARAMKSYVEKTPVLGAEVAAKRSCANEDTMIAAGTEKTRAQPAQFQPTQTELAAALKNLTKTKPKK